MFGYWAMPIKIDRRSKLQLYEQLKFTLIVSRDTIFIMHKVLRHLLFFTDQIYLLFFETFDFTKTLVFLVYLCTYLYNHQ